MGVCCGKDKEQQKPFRPGEDVMRRQDEEELKQQEENQLDPANGDAPVTHMPAAAEVGNAADPKLPADLAQSSLQRIPSLNKKNTEPNANPKSGQLASLQNLKDAPKPEKPAEHTLNRLNTAEKRLWESPDQQKDSSMDESLVKKVSQKVGDTKLQNNQPQVAEKDRQLAGAPAVMKPKLKQGEQELMIDVPEGTLIKAQELHQAIFNSQNSRSRPPVPQQNQPAQDIPSQLIKLNLHDESKPKQSDRGVANQPKPEPKAQSHSEKDGPGSRRISIDQHIVIVSPQPGPDNPGFRVSSDHLSALSPSGSGVMAGSHVGAGTSLPEAGQPKRTPSADRLPPTASQLGVGQKSPVPEAGPRVQNLGMHGLKSVFTINEITEPDPTIIAGDGLGKPSAVNSPVPGDEVIGSESVHIKLSVNHGDRTDQNLKMIPEQQLNVVSLKPNFFNTRQVMLETAWPQTDKQKKEEAKELAETKKYEEIHEMVRGEKFLHVEQAAVFEDGWMVVHGEGEVLKEN